MFPVEPVPEQIGAYTVVKYLGRAGASDQYVARMDGPLGFQRAVMLKMVRFAIDDDARFAEELAREAAICSRLNHPAVVRMYDFFEHDRRLVLVLEQVEGAPLDKLVSHLGRRKQKLGDAAIYFIASQLASALAHAHGSVDEDGNLTPVIHRDLRPDNVLVSWDGQVRLAGFGLGKILGRTPDSVAGTVRGTPGYMSPEQLRGERATVRSDVYGLGALLWSLLADQEPPSDGSRPPSLTSIRTDLQPEIVALVEAALEPSPDRRRITCAEMVQWLAKMRPEMGREELRQKVLVLRSSRTAVLDPHDVTRAPRPAKPSRRRAAAQGRPSARRPSSPPSARMPMSRRDGMAIGGVAIPPPPPLPEAVTEEDLTGPASDPPTQVRSGSAIPRPSQRSGAPPSSRSPRFPSHGSASQGPASQAPDSGSRANTARPASLHAPATIRTVASVPPRGATPRSVMPASLRPPPMPVIEMAADAFRHDEADVHGHADLVQHEFANEAWRASPLHLQMPVHQHAGHPGERQLPVLVQMALAALTAGLVVAIGLFVIQNTRRDQVLVQAAPAQQPAPAPVRVEEPARQPAIESPRSPPPATTVAPASKAMDAADDASTLSSQEGYLTVRGPSNADVFLNGVRRGPTNVALRVACGRFFLRLAPPDPGRFPAWVGDGETVSIPCKASTVFQPRWVDGGPRATPGPGQTGL